MKWLLSLALIMLIVHHQPAFTMQALQQAQQQAAQREQLTAMLPAQRMQLQQLINPPPIVPPATSEDADAQLAQAIQESLKTSLSSTQSLEQELLTQAQEASLAQHAAEMEPTGTPDKKVGAYSFHQLAVMPEDQQLKDGISCGPRVLLIARAFENLATAGTPINPENLHTQLTALEYHEKITCHIESKEDLAAEEFEESLKTLTIQLPHYFILGIYDNQIALFGPAKELSVLISFPQKIKSLAQNKKSFHCICNIPGITKDGKPTAHWVLISVLFYKKDPTAKDPTAHVWYIDTLNKKVDNNPNAQKYLQEIMNCLPPQSTSASSSSSSSSSSSAASLSSFTVKNSKKRYLV